MSIERGYKTCSLLREFLQTNINNSKINTKTHTAADKTLKETEQDDLMFWIAWWGSCRGAFVPLQKYRSLCNLSACGIFLQTVHVANQRN
jgi:hypothetical protein